MDGKKVIIISIFIKLDNVMMVKIASLKILIVLFGIVKMIENKIKNLINK